MYPANDSTTALYLARMRADEVAARNERARVIHELRAARSTDDTSPRPQRRWVWSLKPWSVRSQAGPAANA